MCSIQLQPVIRCDCQCSVDNIKQPVGSWDNIRIVSQSYVNKILSYHLTACVRIVRKCSKNTISEEEGKDQESIQSSESPYGIVTKTQGNITYKRAIPAGDHKAAQGISSNQLEYLIRIVRQSYVNEIFSYPLTAWIRIEASTRFKQILCFNNNIIRAKIWSQ